SPRLVERGKIKIGQKGAMVRSQRGREFQPPQKLDHFVVTTLERGPDGNFLRDAEIHARFGASPTELPIRLLYDDPVRNFMTRYACYVGRSLWCTGDGEVATRISERPLDLYKDGTRRTDFVAEPRQVECTCERQLPTYTGRVDRCKMNGLLSCILDDVPVVG